MTKDQALIVATELKSMGFRVVTHGTFVDYISVLPFINRSVNTGEVETALAEKFEDIEFNISKMYGIVVIQ